jgi:mutator protein MutT
LNSELEISEPSKTVEVALAIIWRAGCLLISRRPDDAHLGGLWEFPGGKLNPGETPEQCAVREAAEEVGVGCQPRRCMAPLVYAYPERTVRLHPVECDYLGGAPRPLAVAEWAWVLPSDLKNYSFPAANEPLVEALSRRGGGSER